MFCCKKTLRTHILCPTLASQGWPRPALANFCLPGTSLASQGWAKQVLANFGLPGPGWVIQKAGQIQRWPTSGNSVTLVFQAKNLSSSSSRGSSDSKHPGLRCSAFLAELVANASQFLTDRATYGMEPLVNSGAAQYTPILSQISGADKPSSA